MQRKIRVSELLTSRQEFGQYDSTALYMDKMRVATKKNLRITPDLFQEMVEKLSSHLRKQYTL